MTGQGVPEVLRALQNMIHDVEAGAGRVIPSLAAAQRMVVKIGSALVVDQKQAAPRTAWLASVAADIAGAAGPRAPRSSWFPPAPSRWPAARLG